jgi:hypothetical protein
MLYSSPRMGGIPRYSEAGCVECAAGIGLPPSLKGILLTIGQIGYQRATEEGGLPTSEAFAEAYGAGVELVYDSLMAAAKQAGGSCEERLCAAIVHLFELVEAEPVIAKALLVDARAAGPAVLDKYTEIVERLSRALDGARRETGSRHSSSPLTGTFIVGAIEFSVWDRLRRGEPMNELWDDLAPLIHFAMTPLFGEAEAWRAFEAARAIAADRRRG